MRAKNYFQINGFALCFALKQSLGATQKLPDSYLAVLPVLVYYTFVLG